MSVQVKAKRFEFAAAVDRAGRISREGDPTIVEIPDDWMPEHLVLAGLVRCTIASLTFHAGRTNLTVAAASGSASGTVTARETDGRYAFVEIEARLDIELEPRPGPDDLAALLAKAERDCFVGASLATSPRYRWTVNGADAR